MEWGQAFQKPYSFLGRSCTAPTGSSAAPHMQGYDRSPYPKGDLSHHPVQLVLLSGLSAQEPGRAAVSQNAFSGAPVVGGEVRNGGTVH